MATLRERQLSRWVRLLLLMKLTEGTESLSMEDANRLAEKLQVSERTIWRDWKLIQEFEEARKML